MVGDPSGEHDDTLDAAYWMLYAARHHLTGVVPAGEGEKLLSVGWGKGELSRRRNSFLRFC